VRLGSDFLQVEERRLERFMPAPQIGFAFLGVSLHQPSAFLWRDEKMVDPKDVQLVECPGERFQNRFHGSENFTLKNLPVPIKSGVGLQSAQ
jgi:hypothetical protein